MENLRRRRSLVVVAFVVSATSSAAESHPSELPFRLFQDHLIVVMGSIAGSERLRFLVDTGCTETLIDEKVARKLRLPTGAEVDLASFKDGRAREVMVPELRFGPVGLRSARMLTADLSGLAWSGTGIDAVIGLDVLTLDSFSVDYASRRIKFGPVPESPSAVAFQSVSPLLIVDVAIGNRIARLMVDTGAPRLTLFPNRMASRLPGFLLKGARTARSAGGASELRDIELAAVRLGETEWRHVPALLVDVQASSYKDFDGVLSPSSLAVQSIDFDFERNRLSWRK